MKEEENPFERKCCYDCNHLHSAVTWWCGNKKAIEARGTSIPGVRECKFWSPDWSTIPKKHRTKENGYLNTREKLLIFLNKKNRL